MTDIGYTGAEYLKEEMESRGMTSEIIWGPSASDIQNNLRNGKVMLVSVNSSTIFTSGSHIMTIVDINSDGQIYICNPSSSTNEGWFDVSEVLKGCDYIVVTEAVSSGVTNNDSDDSDDRIANTSSYVAVVATWNQTETKLTSNDPNVQEYDNINYSMTTTTVNYQEMVDKYTMPFDFLWALLVTGEDKEFVFELADLVYNSDIQVTIYDNLTVNTDIDEWKYDEQCKTQADIAIVGSSGQYSAARSESNHEHENIVGQYSTTKTVITRTNTINQILTRADTWIVDYTNSYDYESTVSGGGSGSSVGHSDQEYPTSPTSTGTSFSCEHTEQYKQDIINEITQNASAKNTSSTYAAASGNNFDPATISFFETYAVRYYNRYINISEVITNTIETKKYIEGNHKLEEKTKTTTDKNGNPEQVNFITIYNKKEHAGARKKINSITSWLFEIIEINGKPDLDLVKYLLYKATGEDYGVTEYNFDEYEPSKFTSVSNLYGGTIQEKVWFALKDLGYSDEQAAGALGNIDYESSGFQPSAIEGGSGEGIGLCQWSYGRKTGLINYAASKGKEWKDEDIQVEFLITELNGGDGPAKGYAESQFMANNNTGWVPSQFFNATNYDIATEAFCWTFERPNVSDANVAERKNRAKKYFLSFAGKERPGNDSRIGEIKLSGDNTEKMTKMLTEALRIADDDRYSYSQPERWGEYSYDCSSFVYRLYKQYFNKILPMTTTERDYGDNAIKVISNMSTSNLKPGDVLWCSYHVAIYLGNGQYVHASNETNGILVSTYTPGVTFVKAYRYVE